MSEPNDLPFMLRPPGATSAALLVHGFTGTPWEMRLLGKALAIAGIASLAIRLPGHGTSPEDLAKKRWEEWDDAVQVGYTILCKDYSSIYGIGMSTGCLLLLAAARTNPMSGLVLFSPYLRIQHWLAPYAGWLKWFRPYQVKPEADNSQKHYYRRRPLAGIHQINRLIKRVRSQLPLITCPVLAFNGEGDQTVDIESGRELIDRMASEIKDYRCYGADVPHVLTREENPYRVKMFTQAIEFIQGLEGPEHTVSTR
ncbi:MAG: alpha/beta fold hydrolase [Desulfuromonadales bacterium]|nr:alpha/beta fold hydrolase [Desulfuromonadales bacterium]MDH4026404.1 alpha/beta fold hydrolase [Desulfuromonadales bacterium]